MEGKYFNEGWFGQHLVIYDIASWFLAPIRRRAVRLLGSARLKALDLATGTGALALALAREGHDVTGVDLDPSMLARAERKRSPALSLEFRHCDATALPFGDRTFDVATVSFAMHDVPYAIGLGILREAKRVLKSSGVLLVVDYQELAGGLAARILHGIALRYESPNYDAFVRRSTLQYLKAAGFRSVQRRTFLGAVQITSAR